MLYKGNVTTHLIRGSRPPPFKCPVAALDRILPLPLSFSGFAKFYHVPLCRPNLGAFFDSGHAYAANFLLTFVDHTRYGERPNFSRTDFRTMTLARATVP